ncbi:Putative glyoxylase CFP32 [Streptomyces hundungensis]|uniref:Glyoxylase CFP32 n=1 Tax=Streptomyces hundungensis TaxID=1077946 RepID=A0A387H6F8_9ACTN|nr:VOC family protein [Streptomyces hundungensis]AYG78974.1 Putative glyoxylase CFP32 [Streptomyces hundungensis]
MTPPTTNSTARLGSGAPVFGAPCWVSLMARDLRATQDFYGAVLGWTFRSGALGEQFRIALADGVPIAGIGALAPALQVAVAWTPYFAVEDADVTASRIRERGGTVAVGPVALHTGRGALASDRDGAVFGLWQGPLVPEWEQWRDTAPVWTRLQTRDAFAAAIFYGEVLDWACDRPGCCDVRYEHDEVVLRHAGHVVARLTSGAVEAAPDPSLRPHWHTHFTVADPRADAEKARTHGATVLAEGVARSGPWVRLSDPDGATFTLNTKG